MRMRRTLQVEIRQSRLPSEFVGLDVPKMPGGQAQTMIRHSRRMTSLPVASSSRGLRRAEATGLVKRRRAATGGQRLYDDAKYCAHLLVDSAFPRNREGA